MSPEELDRYIAADVKESILREVEARLVETLDDFCGATASTNADDGIDGHGLTLRLVIEGRHIEVRASIEDVTDELFAKTSDDDEIARAIDQILALVKKGR